MLFTFVTIALVLRGPVQATPIASDTSLTSSIAGVDSSSAWKVRAVDQDLTPTRLTPTTSIKSSLPDGIPVVDQDLVRVGAQGNVTLGTGKGGVHADAANSLYPATLLLCKESGCRSCQGFDLSVQPHQTCLTGNVNFLSVYMQQPSNEGLPFAVYTGPIGCGTFYQVPQVNTCYNTNTYIGWDVKLTP